MLHWKALLTSVRRSLRRVHGLWRKATCSPRSLHGSRSTTTVLLRVLVMANLLISLIVLYDVHMVLRPRPTNPPSSGVEALCMDGSLPYMGSLGLQCSVELK